MARASVEFYAEAKTEYLAAVTWYEERSLSAARNFEAEFSQAIEQIRKSPNSWSAYLKGCRRFLLHQFPFQIVYHFPKLRHRFGSRSHASSSWILERTPLIRLLRLCCCRS